MKKLYNLLKQNALSIVIMAVLVGITVWGMRHSPQAKTYHCDLAEFHPDFPIRAREECRQLRREQHAKDK
jgi:hypothetical protein